MKGDRILSKKQINWFKNNYPKLGGEECEKILGVAKEKLNNIASAHKLKILPATKSRVQKKNAELKKMHQKIKRNKFADTIKINSPELSYALGFIWGDGHLRSSKSTYCRYPSIEIIKQDFDEIYPILMHMGNWSISSRQRGNRKMQSMGTLCDGGWGVFLENQDYGEKSFVSPYKILSEIEPTLQNYWWRGYSDADGCFYLHETNNICQYSISGTYSQDWGESEKIMKQLEITFKTKSRIQNDQSKSSLIQITNRDGIQKWGDYIYSGDIKLGLTRKKEKFESIIRHIDQ